LLSGVGCVVMNRVQEAMELHKILCDEIGKESLDPDAILEFARVLLENSETSQALTILEEYLYNIERSWGKREQCLAYQMFISNVNCPPRRRRIMRHEKLQR